MNTLHLKYIVEVAKTGSITLAAENLYMNQPNLSKAIKEFEASIGINIFKRTSKGFVPTKKGEEFLGYAKNILNQVEEMESLYKADIKNKILFRISVPRASYISHAFTQYIEQLDETKDWDMSFKETNSMQTIQDVVEGECHMGIIRYQKNYESYFLNFLKDKRLQYQDIWEYEYLALMSTNNPLASSDTISYKELNKCIEIVHGDIMVPHLSLVELKNNEKHKKRRVYVYERGSQFDLLCQIPTSYMWVSPLPQQLLNRYGLIQRNCTIADEIFKDILIYPKGYQLSKIDNAFIQEVNRVKNSISKS